MKRSFDYTACGERSLSSLAACQPYLGRKAARYSSDNSDLGIGLGQQIAVLNANQLGANCDSKWPKRHDTGRDST